MPSSVVLYNRRTRKEAFHLPKKSYLFFGITICLIIITFLLLKSALLSNTDKAISEQLKNANIDIEVEGAQISKLTTDDFLKMNLVEKH